MKIIRYFSRGLSCLMAALLILGLFPAAPAQAAEVSTEESSQYTGNLVNQSGTLLAEGTPVASLSPSSSYGIGQNESSLPTPEAYIRANFNGDYLTVTEDSSFEAQDVLHLKQTLVDKSVVPADYTLEDLMGSESTDTTDEEELEAQAELFMAAMLQQFETDIMLYDVDPDSDFFRLSITEGGISYGRTENH